MHIQWEGVMPALTTPFTEGDELDLPLFSKQLRLQKEAGVHAVILGGSLGEASTLTGEEKGRLVAHAVSELQGSIPVICNIAEQSTKQAVQAALEAEEQGADGLMLLPPMRYKATDQEVVTFFSEVARASSLPIMIYNNPVDYKIAVTPDMFEELLAYDTIQAVKESSRDISNVHMLKARFGDRLRILCGVDTLALESFFIGADGWVAGLVCAFPKETVAIYRLFREGRFEEALEIYRWFMPLLELDLSPQLVQNIKLAQVATDSGTEVVRPPRLPLRGAERERVWALLQERIGSRPDLPQWNDKAMVTPN